MTTTINFKIDLKVKKEAQNLAKGFGLSLNDFLNLVIENFIQNEMDSKRKYNPKFLRIRESRRRNKEGRSFSKFQECQKSCCLA